MAILLIRDGYFYIGTVIEFQYFLDNFWLQPKAIVLTLNIKLFCCKNHKRCSVEEDVLKSFPCNFIKKKTPTQVFSCETCQYFKNIYFQEYLSTTTSLGHYRKKYSSISLTKLELHNYYYNL